MHKHKIPAAIEYCTTSAPGLANPLGRFINPWQKNCWLQDLDMGLHLQRILPAATAVAALAAISMKLTQGCKCKSKQAFWSCLKRSKSLHSNSCRMRLESRGNVAMLPVRFLAMLPVPFNGGIESFLPAGLFRPPKRCQLLVADKVAPASVSSLSKGEPHKEHTLACSTCQLYGSPDVQRKLYNTP